MSVLEKISNEVIKNKYKILEQISKKILNKFGYPNNIECEWHKNGDVFFIDCEYGNTVAYVKHNGFDICYVCTID